MQNLILHIWTILNAYVILAFFLNKMHIYKKNNIKLL